MPRNEEMRRPAGEDDARGPYVYHGRGLPAERGKETDGAERKGLFGGVLRNNPMLALVLVDIVVILLVVVFLYPFLQGSESSARVGGYSFDLNAYLEGEWVYVNVVVKKGEEGGEPAGTQVEIVFSLPGTAEHSRHVIPSPRPGDPRIVRSRLSAGEAQEARAEVHFAGEKTVLHQELEQ